MKTTVPFVDLKAQQRAVKNELRAACDRLFDECNFILGAPVAEFEQAFAQFIGAKHAIGVGTGLDALSLALRAVGVQPGDEVIVPANTFIATALGASQIGAVPKFVDCDPLTWEIDATKIAAAITPRTKAIMPVHLYGMSAHMDRVLALAGEFGLAVIEDAAQAHGTRYDGKGCGAMGAAGCFSFYPAKNLGCCGDGGAVVTNSDSVAAKVRSLRNYGQKAKYEHVEQGGNSRLDTLQAAILSAKLPLLAGWNAARAKHAALYRELLAGVGDIEFQQLDPKSNHIYHLLVAKTAHRTELQSFLKDRGIETGIHYPVPVHLQPAYRELGHGVSSYPVAEALALRIVSLPMYAELTDAQIEYTCDAVKEFFTSGAGQRATTGLAVASY